MPPVVTHFINATFPVGDTYILWTVADTSGNVSTCSTLVRILDGEVPTITCPANITVETNAEACTPNENTAFVTVPTPITADNCGVASVINSYNNTNNASDEYPIGTTPVNWVVTDVNGRTAYCVMNITVIKCCLAESGTVAVNDHICPGGTITSTLQGNNTSAGYQTLFIVTNTTNGTIVAINNTGSFPTLGAGLAAGNFG